MEMSRQLYVRMPPLRKPKALDPSTFVIKRTIAESQTTDSSHSTDETTTRVNTAKLAKCNTPVFDMLADELVCAILGWVVRDGGKALLRLRCVSKRFSILAVDRHVLHHLLHWWRLLPHKLAIGFYMNSYRFVDFSSNPFITDDTLTTSTARTMFSIINAWTNDFEFFEAFCMCRDERVLRYIWDQGSTGVRRLERCAASFLSWTMMTQRTANAPTTRSPALQYPPILHGLMFFLCDWAWRPEQTKHMDEKLRIDPDYRSESCEEQDETTSSHVKFFDEIVSLRVALLEAVSELLSVYAGEIPDFRTRIILEWPDASWTSPVANRAQCLVFENALIISAYGKTTGPFSNPDMTQFNRTLVELENSAVKKRLFRRVAPKLREARGFDTIIEHMDAVSMASLVKTGLFVPEVTEILSVITRTERLCPSLQRMEALNTLYLLLHHLTRPIKVAFLPQDDTNADARDLKLPDDFVTSAVTPMPYLLVYLESINPGYRLHTTYNSILNTPCERGQRVGAMSNAEAVCQLVVGIHE